MGDTPKAKAPKPPPGPRDLYAGPPDGPESPYPIKVRGKVVKGFGRGSKELGFPTANIPITSLLSTLPNGIYIGWVALDLRTASSSSSPSISTTSTTTSTTTTPALEKQKALPPATYEAVLSLGQNPYYDNEQRTLEVHVPHEFGFDFYGARVNLLILAFVRPEYDYDSLEALKADIGTDVEVARRSLAREPYVNVRESSERQWLEDFGWEQGEGEGEVVGDGGEGL
ncbi:MAG: hypothetical protein M1819_002729 [Sarea resinae]|nr:MAG: hypothetical protein M1819_002729 [Sarea resinae]